MRDVFWWALITAIAGAVPLAIVIDQTGEHPAQWPGDDTGQEDPTP